MIMLPETAGTNPQLAMPDALSAALHSGAPPEVKVTDPVGTPAAEVTVAVRVAGDPVGAGDGETLTAVLLVACVMLSVPFTNAKV
jgi:hypothetical protein